MMRGFAVITMIAGLLAAAPACTALRAPEMPTPIATPTALVQSVRLVEAGPDANRYMLTVLLSNPNDFALPLLDADYRVQVGSSQYRGDTAPNRTLPASGEILVELPAVLTTAEGDYQVGGSLEMDPPQQLKQVFYEFGLPRPRVSFSGRGPIEVAANAVPATDPAPAGDAAPAPATQPPATP